MRFGQIWILSTGDLSFSAIWYRDAMEDKITAVRRGDKRGRKADQRDLFICAKCCCFLMVLHLYSHNYILLFLSIFMWTEPLYNICVLFPTCCKVPGAFALKKKKTLLLLLVVVVSI